MTAQTKLTCTCGSRFLYGVDHESDCDLWLIDEFWAGFLNWDPDAEALVKTNLYPAGHESEYVDPYFDRDEEYQWDNDDMPAYQQKLAEMDQRDRDIALTTDAFIERMLDRLPEDDTRTWVQDTDGKWKPTGGDTTSAYTGKVHNYTGKAWQDSDGYDWNSYGSDRHTATPLTFADGTTVYCTSSSKRNDREAPDFGLYMDNAWIPDSMAIMLPWFDYGLPKVSYQFAKYAIEEAFSWASAGAKVEVGCIGAHGRTGTVLACMAILAGGNFDTGYDAVDWVRDNYCQHAVESAKQEWFVCWYHAQFHGYEFTEPEPTYTPAPKVEEVAPVTPLPVASVVTTPVSRSGGQPTKGKARRGKRGGKRQQRHKNRMAQGSRR